MEHLIAAINPEISSATGAPWSQFQQQGKSQPMDDAPSSLINGNGANHSTFAATVVPDVSHRVPWHTRFKQLKSFHSRHGHTKVPETSTLALWSSSQRKQYRMYVQLENGAPPPHLTTKLLKEATGVIKTRINLLNSLGFQWDVEPTHENEQVQPTQKRGRPKKKVEETEPSTSCKPEYYAEESHGTPETEIELADLDDLDEEERAVSQAAMDRGGCGRCEVCLRPDVDCQKCRFCKDMKKYGGDSVLRKRCALRQRKCLVNFVEPRKAREKRKRDIAEPNSQREMRKRGRPRGSTLKKPSYIPSSDIAAARGERAKPLSNKRVRSRGCGECPTCLKPDCQECKFCKDMKKYGGPNLLRQRCMYRRRCPVLFASSDPEDEPDSAAKDKMTKTHGRKEEQEAITVQTPRGRVRKISRKMQESYHPSGTGLDDANSGEEENKQWKSTNGSTNTFPQRLLEMINKTSIEAPHILEWLPCGSAFKVKEPNLIGPILKKYFKHDKHTSFLRQLYHYGFKKHTKGYYRGCYHNPQFHRDVVDSSNISQLVTKHAADGNSDEGSSPRKNQGGLRPRPIGLRSSPTVNSSERGERATPTHTLLTPNQKDSSSGPRSSRKRESNTPFAATLHDFVSTVSKSNPDVIRWLPDGKGFVVSKTSEEEFGPLVEKYFNYRKFKSFHRQLNFHGFSKYPKDKFNGAFHHPDFRKDIRSKAELRRIARKDASPTVVKSRRSSRLRGEEPDDEVDSKGNQGDNDSEEESAEEDNDDELAALKSAAKVESTDEDEAVTSPRMGIGRTKKVVDRKKRANISRVEECIDSDFDGDDDDHHNFSNADSRLSNDDDEDEEANSDDEPASIGDIAADEDEEFREDGTAVADDESDARDENNTQIYDNSDGESEANDDGESEVNNDDNDQGDSADDSNDDQDEHSNISDADDIHHDDLAAEDDEGSEVADDDGSG
eukprot:CAMPEP_0171356546 /NCGR_PEP_ID=MMETSP0878-20121228/45782_1 /TAXON_ID=67004 /ORGANISM="Thalassiosira weissflogii, Strain CCMP1336" /LENGTH=951 /DNA_ID=CAMNT_0011862571 /DNA_START=216 /DNA_END=3071 /DNA_ORIENTATION=-